MTPDSLPIARFEHPAVWLTTKALPFGKVSSRLRLDEISPDLWPAALKSVSLRWHTASPRSNNGSRITARIRTGHGALISRNYPGENRDFLSRAAQPRASPPGRSRNGEHFQKTREHPLRLHRNIALTLRAHGKRLATGRRHDGVGHRSCICAANCHTWLDERWSNFIHGRIFKWKLNTFTAMVIIEWPDFSIATWRPLVIGSIAFIQNWY